MQGKNLLIQFKSGLNNTINKKKQPEIADTFECIGYINMGHGP